MIKLIKQKYYQYKRDEFLPIYVNGKMVNTREFHKYRIGGLVKKLAPVKY